ncbi:GntR family transcriptional regulator [Hymenobacter qilianensis]|uniref:GntR family transcriptional regulator n=2 Tax=Hymenobacter qilianensis TaxID=1385715 RepID=A0ACB5PTH3_9BACT|nr:S1-like domain-containing RNA-binding protein [Hymenobacter qilianensis]QNP52748.1 GntR family transcriptional regulator [Hymenobacter qilianensis]GGF70320.1 GntR family transcriptional regulator [Hymenobacter qilianensis]
MLALGDYNELEVARAVDFGLYLTSDDGDLLLPIKYVPEGTQIGDRLRVFVYRDSEDRLIATTLEPLARVGEFAALTVRDVSSNGAFLEWGLEKDLFLPYRNQRQALRVGQRATVYVYLDENSDRIVASSKWEKYLPQADFPGKAGDQVELFVAQDTDLGYTVIVNGAYLGLVYHNEVFRPLRLGDKPTGYVRQIRPDGKLDISLQKVGYDEALDATETILTALRASGGALPLSDKSEPDDIYRRLGMSKKVFKKALGTLYKRGLVQLAPDETRLLGQE